jgi:hypothetical protein
MRMNYLLEYGECAVDICICYNSSVLRAYTIKWY